MKHSKLSIATIILSILFFPAAIVTGLIDVIKGNKEEKHTLSYVGLGIAVLILVVGIANRGSGTQESTVAETPTETVEEAGEDSTAEVAVEKSEELPEPESQQALKDEVADLINSRHFVYSDLEISGVTSDTIMVSLHYDDTSWNETEFIRSCLTDYIDMAQKVYAMEGIERFGYMVFCDFTDTKGNKKSEKGFSILMPKKNYTTYTWENLKFTPGIYSQVESDCEYLDIHGAIRMKVDFDDVYYKG